MEAQEFVDEASDEDEEEDVRPRAGILSPIGKVEEEHAVDHDNDDGVPNVGGEDKEGLDDDGVPNVGGEDEEELEGHEVDVVKGVDGCACSGS